jgi:hypothetical protein
MRGAISVPQMKNSKKGWTMKMAKRVIPFFDVGHFLGIFLRITS